MRVSDVTDGLLESVGRGALLMMLLTLGIAVAADALPTVVRYAPFVISVLFLGLPHGAADHLVPARFDASSLWVSIGVVSLLYALFGGLYLVGWFLAPVAAFVSFIAMTWFHWGQGDVVHAINTLDAPQHRSSVGRILGVFVRGGLPMGVPLVFFPKVYRRVATFCIELFVADANLQLFFTPAVRAGVGLVLGAGTVALVFLSWYKSNSSDDIQAFRITVGELVLLWVFFAAVPPILAIGVYFCFWHAVRHINRIVDGSGGSPRQFAVDAGPTTVLAILITVGLAFVVPTQPTEIGGLLGVYLVAIAVFTLPHVLVVLWMDYNQGLWTT